MTHTNTQPEALRLAHSLSGGKLIDDSMEWADTLHAAAEELRRLHARITELEAQVQPTEEVPVVPQGVNAPNEWEEIRTLPTCDDLIWLYCQDTNTIDGPIAPEPNLEQYGWTHWAYANAPSTAWIDTAQAKQGGV